MNRKILRRVLPLLCMVSMQHIITTHLLHAQVWEGDYGNAGAQRGFAVTKIQHAINGAGGYVAVGKSNNGVGTIDSIYAIKVNKLGFLIWQKTYAIPGSGPDTAFAVYECANGDLAVVGSTGDALSCSNPIPVGSSTASQNIFMMRLTSNGNELWQRTYGGIDPERGLAVIETSHDHAGDLVIAGSTKSFGAGHTDNTTYTTNADEDAFLLRTDSNGILKWAKTMGNSDVDYFASVTEAANGDLVAAGAIKVGGTRFEPLLVRTNSGGMIGAGYGANTFQQSYTVTGAGDVVMNAVKEASTGNLILTGVYKNASGAKTELIILKTTAAGGTPTGAVYVEATAVRPSMGYDIIECANGDYLAVGAYTLPFTTQTSVYAIEVTTGLVKVRSSHFGTNGQEARSVQEVPAGGVWGATGGFIMCGKTITGPGSDQLYLIRTNTNIATSCNGTPNDTRTVLSISGNSLTLHTCVVSVTCSPQVVHQDDQTWGENVSCQ